MTTATQISHSSLQRPASPPLIMSELPDEPPLLSNHSLHCTWPTPLLAITSTSFSLFSPFLTSIQISFTKLYIIILTTSLLVPIPSPPDLPISNRLNYPSHQPYCRFFAAEYQPANSEHLPWSNFKVGLPKIILSPYQFHHPRPSSSSTLIKPCRFRPKPCLLCITKECKNSILAPSKHLHSKNQLHGTLLLLTPHRKAHRRRWKHQQHPKTTTEEDSKLHSAQSTPSWSDSTVLNSMAHSAIQRCQPLWQDTNGCAD